MQTHSTIKLSSFFSSESDHFHVDPDNIILMTQRDRSTHLNLIDGLTITVCETSEEILALIKTMEDQRDVEMKAWRERNPEVGEDPYPAYHRALNSIVEAEHQRCEERRRARQHDEGVLPQDGY